MGLERINPADLPIEPEPEWTDERTQKYADQLAYQWLKDADGDGDQLLLNLIPLVASQVAGKEQFVEWLRVLSSNSKVACDASHESVNVVRELLAKRDLQISELAKRLEKLEEGS
jgi:hypothetical protein